MSKSALQIKMEKLLAEARARKEAAQASSNINTAQTEIAQAVETVITDTIETEQQSNQLQGTDRFGNTITYNVAQAKGIELISSGEDCVVIGPAGTGKTTIQKGATQALMANGSLKALNADHRYLTKTAPGIAICAYTRRATNNIRKNLSADLQQCCITIHKLLEYQPEEQTIIDPETGKEKTTKPFKPQRHADNPLPETLTTIIIEEASMVSVELFNELVAACPHNPQFVFLGDIQQLPPVFGSAILGYKMLELPVVELTEVYRQALESPILSLAHRILSGKEISPTELKTLNVKDKLTLHPWQKKIEADSATGVLASFFIKALDKGMYNPETDGILIPFNKSCGTDELNKHIATQVAKREFKAVYEIIHGWKKSYYSVGDKCLFEREDAIIKSILPNPPYVGGMPRTESRAMDYWGYGQGEDTGDSGDIDAFLDHVSAGTNEDGEKKQRAASHIIELYLLDSDTTVRIKSAGEIDALILGYAITVHKSQGSEWAKVFLLFHHSHATMLQRELLYTGVTRAKEELFVICEPDTFVKGIKRQRIKGSTWQEKAEYFKGKLENMELQS